MCLIHDRNFRKASLNMVISLEILYKGVFCSESCLTSYHNGNVITGFKA